MLEVVKWSYTQGQARASGNVQVEYRNLRTGGKTGERMSPSDKVERAVLDSEVGFGMGLQKEKQTASRH